MIQYPYMDLLMEDSTYHDFLITDGDVQISGTNYTITNATITVTNDLMDSEAFNLYQTMCSASQLTFGACESASVEFVVYENVPSLKGKTVKVYIYPDHDASKMLQLGVFKIYEDTLTADRLKRNVKGYDALYEILNADVAAWYNSLLPNKNSTVTLAEMRFAFTAYFGLTQETISLPNDSMVVKRTIEPESLSGADVIKSICELEGCFGQINNEGKFRYIVLSAGIDDGLFPSENLYPSDELYPQDVNHDVTVIPKSQYIAIHFEDYLVESITQLVIRANDEDVGVSVGTDGNTYTITGNFLVLGKGATELRTIATNAFENMKNRYYKPCTIECAGNPCHEVGDPLRLHTTYRGVVTYILERRLSGVHGLRDEYSAGGTQYFNQQLNFSGTQYKQLVNKTMSIKKDVDGIAVDLSDLDSRESSHYSQTSSQISFKVSKGDVLNQLEDEMSGITIESNAIKVSSTGKFTVDSSNFRINDLGEVKAHTMIFDSSASSDPEALTINNDSLVIGTGSATAGYTYIGRGLLFVSGANGNTSMNPNEVQISDASTTVILSCDSSKLLVNGTPVMMQSSEIMIGNASQTYVEINSQSISIGGAYATTPVLISAGNGIDTSKLTVNGRLTVNDHILSFQTVVDTNGNTVHVLGY